MNRRIFLRGLGGAVVAAPFLGSLRDRGARAQTVAAPRRLIAMFTHYGCITNRFFPAKSHGALTAADLEPTTLKPLAPFVAKLLMPRGIRAMNEWTSKVLRGQGNDANFQVTKSFFTCQPVTPNQDNPFRFNDSALFRDMPLGPSLDHVIAQSIVPDSLPFVLQVGNNRDSVDTTASWSASEKAYVGLPANQALTKLTGLFPGGAPLSPDSYQAARGQSIIDLVKSDLESLERRDMSLLDKRKLAAWKELLHQTTNAVVQCGPGGPAALGLSAANISATTTSIDGDSLADPVTATLDKADIFSGLAALGALCNANPVILLKYPANHKFSALGLTLEAHALSHRVGTAGMGGDCLPGVVDMLLEIDDYYTRKFAYLVGLLDSIDEGDRTLLDNTAAVWFQEMSDGAAHNLNNLPIVQAGGAGGYFKTGWAINVEDGSPNLTRGNSEAECLDGAGKINGIDQATGTDPALANAPINKYYCNLMNMLGVKAGADGFAVKDGTAEVTKFGMYDKTEDFIHGVVNPPTIHDPGEFTALRAT